MPLTGFCRGNHITCVSSQHRDLSMVYVLCTNFQIFSFHNSLPQLLIGLDLGFWTITSKIYAYFCLSAQGSLLVGLGGPYAVLRITLYLAEYTTRIISPALLFTHLI